MDGARAAVSGIDLPTGVLKDDQVLKSIKFREMAGPEEDIMASNMTAGQKLSEVMLNCTMEFSGISDRPTLRKLIDKMVVTDRWLYLVQLRALSLGSSYRFESTCPSCGSEDKVNYDLNQIQVKNPPDAKMLFSEATLPSGRTVRWKIADGETDAKIEKLATTKNAATIALFARCTEVDKKPAVIADVLNMSLKDRIKFREEIDSKEGDFDDEFDAVCPKCSHEYKAQLRLDGRSFFSL
jgi:hypothetical protein